MFASPITPVIIVITTVLILVILIILINKTPFGRQTLPYRKRTYLMHEREKQVFLMLMTAIPSGYVLFPQVVISSIVQATGSSHTYWHYQNQINKKTLDFVVFSLPDYVPVLAIEYDGHMHNTPKRQARDSFVNNVMLSVGIPILHISHTRNLNVAQIRNTLARIITTNAHPSVSQL